MFDLQNYPEWPHLYQLKQRFSKAGHKLYLVGGCVRDLLLARKPKDFDFATSATPEDMQALFAKTNDIGKAFGTIQIVLNDKTYEVTTFRKDLSYEDGRHPTEVSYSDEIEDAKRRDFTMNALFYDLESGLVIDHVGGQKDIQQKIIRFIGCAEERIEEDKLRLLRALRFVSVLGFDLEETTLQAVKKNVVHLQQVSRERIHEETQKLISGDFFHRVIPYLRDTSLLDVLFGSSLDQTKLKDFLDSSRNDYVKVQVAYGLANTHLFSILFYGLLLKVDTVDWRKWRWSKDLYSSVLLFRMLIRRFKSPLSKAGVLQSLNSLEGNLLFINRRQISLDAENVDRMDEIYGNHLPFEKPLAEPLVNGQDLLALGFQPNKQMGEILEKLYNLQLEEGISDKLLLLSKAPKP